MQEEYILIANERALRRNLPCDGVSQLHDTARETDAQGKLPDAKMFWMFTDAWSAMARLFIRPNRHRLSNKTGSTTMQCRWRERLQFRSNLIQIPVNLLEKTRWGKKPFFSRKSIRKHWRDNQVCPGKQRETRCLESDNSFDWPLHRRTNAARCWVDTYWTFTGATHQDVESVWEQGNGDVERITNVSPVATKESNCARQSTS